MTNKRCKHQQALLTRSWHPPPRELERISLARSTSDIQATGALSSEYPNNRTHGFKLHTRNGNDQRSCNTYEMTSCINRSANSRDTHRPSGPTEFKTGTAGSPLNTPRPPPEGSEPEQRNAVSVSERDNPSCSNSPSITSTALADIVGKTDESPPKAY